MVTVWCKNCGMLLDQSLGIPVESRTPCPFCGSLSRLGKVEVGGAITPSGALLKTPMKALSGNLTPHRSEFKMKGWSNRKSRPFYEAVIKDDPHRKSGLMMIVKRIIDRRTNYYLEEIRNAKSGELTHKCEEPLDQHTGHGSAKRHKK
jgi:hypothetical protein